MTTQGCETLLSVSFKLFLLSYIQGTRNKESVMKHKPNISVLRVLVGRFPVSRLEGCRKEAPAWAIPDGRHRFQGHKMARLGSIVYMVDCCLNLPLLESQTPNLARTSGDLEPRSMALRKDSPARAPSPDSWKQARTP